MYNTKEVNDAANGDSQSLGIQASVTNRLIQQAPDKYQHL